MKHIEREILVCEENKTLADGLAKMVSEIFYIPVRGLDENGNLGEEIPESTIHYNGSVVKQEDFWSTLKAEQIDYVLIGALDGMFGKGSINQSEFIKYRSVADRIDKHTKAVPIIYVSENKIDLVNQMGDAGHASFIRSNLNGINGVMRFISEYESKRAAD